MSTYPWRNIVTFSSSVLPYVGGQLRLRRDYAVTYIDACWHRVCYGYGLWLTELIDRHSGCCWSRRRRLSDRHVCSVNNGITMSSIHHGRCLHGTLVWVPTGTLLSCTGHLFILRHNIKPRSINFIIVSNSGVAIDRISLSSTSI